MNRSGDNGHEHLVRRIVGAATGPSVRAGVAARHPLLAFFSLAYALSWMLWAPLVADAVGWWRGPVSSNWHLWGNLGPLLAALVVTGATGGTTALRELVARMARWRVGLCWLLVAVLGPVAHFALAAGVVRIAEGIWLDVARCGESTEYPRLPLLVYWTASILCYGYGEEVGWHGFALPCLQVRYGALTASSILSVSWALWHLPLFAFADGLQQLRTGGIVGWYLSLWVGSILLTWLYRRSRPSAGATTARQSPCCAIATPGPPISTPPARRRPHAVPQCPGAGRGRPGARRVPSWPPPCGGRPRSSPPWSSSDR